MNFYIEFLFLAFVGLLHSERAGGIRRPANFHPLGADLVRVTMLDGSVYLGVSQAYPDSQVPVFLEPYQHYDRYFHFIRTEEGHHYMSGLLEAGPFHQHIFGEHNPLHCEISIGNNFYFAGDFEVYPVHLHNHRSTFRGRTMEIQGNFPTRNYIYVGIPNEGIYRAALHTN